MKLAGSMEMTVEQRLSKIEKALKAIQVNQKLNNKYVHLLLAERGLTEKAEEIELQVRAEEEEEE